VSPMGPLILPCETRVREFDAKLLLALVAAVRGRPAVVGNKKRIDLRLAMLKPGVYVGKSLTARSRHNLTLARACGHAVAVWDEEGLVWASREVYWKTKVDADTLNTPELLIAWGKDNARAWSEHPDYAGARIEALGNPRADLLSPRLTALFAGEVDAIRAQHGRFILVNTNFSRVNHVQPRQNRHLKWLREQRPDDPRGGFAAHKFALFKAFCKMLPELARRLPEVQFVIRPHPSEKKATWDALAADLDNVEVAQYGNVVAWLLASDGLIHNGCTTAVEAFQLGRPALAFEPVHSDTYDHPLPNGISLSCPDLDTLETSCRAASADPAALFSRQASTGGRERMANALAGLEDSELASERISAMLAELQPGRPVRRKMVSAALALRRILRVVEERIPGTANYRPYLAHMFPDISLQEAQARMTELGHCLQINRLPEIRQLEQNVFQLQPPADAAA